MPTLTLVAGDDEDPVERSKRAHPSGKGPKKRVLPFTRRKPEPRPPA